MFTIWHAAYERMASQKEAKQISIEGKSPPALQMAEGGLQDFRTKIYSVTGA